MDNKNTNKQPSNKNKKPNLLINRSFKINPIYVIIATFLLILLVLQGMPSSSSTGNLTKEPVNRLIQGILENKVSTIVTNNEGSVIVNEKLIDSSTLGSVSPSLLKNMEIKQEKLSKSEFFERLYNPGSLFEQIRQIINSAKATTYENVFLGDFFVYSVSKDRSAVIYTEDLNVKNFAEESSVYRKTISYQARKTQTFKLSVYSASEDLNLDKSNLEIYDFAVVIGSNILLHKNSKYVSSYQLDWNSNVASIPALLQAEGIPLSSSTFSVITANNPEPIDFGTIMQIILFGILIVGAFMLYKSLQGGGGMGINQFGQSKAKLFFGAKTKTSFADVAGIQEAKEELEEVVQFLRFPSKFIKMGARIPKGILMVGPPGTGKTLLARAIAGEAGVPFFHTSGSEFEEMLVGAGASRVRDLFAKAKKVSPSLIFIDEIDAVARKRGTKVNTGANEQTLNQILVEMDGFEVNDNVIIIAATNRPDVLDPAILRPGRFDRQIRVELPDADGRFEILKVHSKGKPIAATVDLNKLAKKTVGFSGADLENILNESAIISAKKSGTEITNDDIEEAYSKVVLGPAKRSRSRTEKELELVAIHEAGHAVVAWYTPEATPVDRISIVSRGASGGVTMFLPEKDENIVTRNKLISDIIVSLGGRAAEEIFLSDISTGAAADIDRATSIAKRLVQKFGMTKALGLVRYGEHEDNDYLGYAYSSSKNYSEETASKIDKEVYDIIMGCYEKAIDILKNNKHKVEEVSKFLLDNEVMNKVEFEEIMKK